jgi:hypothetical protein
MGTFFRLTAAELLKLRRSMALRMVWLLPLLFLALEFLVFEQSALSRRALSPEFSTNYDTLQLQLAATLWGGTFHPLLIAVLPALLFRPEHRFKVWRHLHSMPVPRRGIFLAKALVLALLCAGSLALVGALLWAERRLIAGFNPLLAFPFHGLDMVKVLGWLWLGSLPLLALYLWVSDRINSLAVPVVFGLLGMILVISLSGADVPQPWKRDLNPWMLPYMSAQEAIHHDTFRQTVHEAGKLFQEEPNVIRLPNGKKIKTWQNVPDDVLFPPAAPTPAWVMGIFSLAAGAALLGLGAIDAGRDRT